MTPAKALERIYFQCPRCGVSFEVRDERSERIYCGPCVRELKAERLGEKP